MKAILVKYDKGTDKITPLKGNDENNWISICEKFNDDVHRVRDIGDMDAFTGLYECIDNDNKCFYYIVEENRELYRVKHKHFLDSIGLKK